MATKKEGKRFPQQGGNNDHHDRICALECTLASQAKTIDELTKRIKKGEKHIMGLQDQVTELRGILDQAKLDIAAEKVEVSAQVAQLNADIKILQDQVNGGEAVTSAQLQELIDSAKEIDTGVKAISEPSV